MTTKLKTEFNRALQSGDSSPSTKVDGKRAQRQTVHPQTWRRLSKSSSNHHRNRMGANVSKRAIADVRAALAELRAERSISRAALSRAYSLVAERLGENDPANQVRALLELLGPMEAGQAPISAYRSLHQPSFVESFLVAPRSASWILRGQYQARRAYNDAVELVLGSGLFDIEYYQTQIGVPANWSPRRLVNHFLSQGAAAGLNPHPLFSCSYYQRENPDLEGLGINPFVHYLANGSREGRNPHPLFDTRYYLSSVKGLPVRDPNPLRDYQLRSWTERLATHRALAHPLFNDSYYLRSHPEVVSVGLTPLEHFVWYGIDLGWNPCPLFNVDYYHSQIDLTQTPLRSLMHYVSSDPTAKRDPHPLFELEYYYTQLVGGQSSEYDPLVHYLTVGGDNGFCPHPLFDSAYYQQQQLVDISSTGSFASDCAFDGTALEHYLEYGFRTSINPHPLFQTDFYCAQKPQLVEEEKVPLLNFLSDNTCDANPHPLFDSKYYLAQNEDVKRTGINPLRHFLTSGGREERSPHPLFDSSYYYSRYGDIAELGLNPLLHFLEFGARESRQPSTFFDVSYYLQENKLLLRDGQNPLEHYLTEGWLEGRSPCAKFDGVYYLASNPELLAKRVEPLSHYVQIGRLRGLKPIAEDTSAYNSWFRRHYAFLPEQRTKAAAWFSKQQSLPAVSVVCDGEELNHKELQQLYRSLRRQVADTWQLVVVNPGADNQAILKKIAAEDSRVLVLEKPESLKSLGWFVAGTKAARGEIVTFVNRAIKFAPESLPLVSYASKKQRAKVIYGDSDTLLAKGRHARYCFHPQWNLELFLATGYASQFAFFQRAEALHSLETSDSSSIEAFMAEMVLQAADEPNSIVHIPRVLTSKLAQSSSWTCCESSEPDGSSLAESDAIRRWAEGRGWVVAANPTYSDLQVVKPKLPAELPLVSVVIPTKDRLELLQVAVEGVLEGTNYPSLELIIVDNNSTDPECLRYLAALGSRSGVKVLTYAGDYNYSAINNEAVRQASGELVCFLNNDIEVRNQDWLLELVRHAVRPDIGPVGARLLFPDGSVQHAGVTIGKGSIAGNTFAGLPGVDRGYQSRAVVTQESSAVTAACMVIKRDLFTELEGFDEAQLSISFNDVDLCLRAKEAGYRVIYCAEAELVHHESASLGSAFNKRRQFRFEKESQAFKARWWREIWNDPFYHPSLSLTGQDFTLANDLRWTPPWEILDEPLVAARDGRDQRLSFYRDLTNLDRSYEVGKFTESRQPRFEFGSGMTVIILTLNKPELICPLLDSLIQAKEKLEGGGLSLQIIVGDTGSTDAAVIKHYEQIGAKVEIVRDLKYHFSACNNQLFYERAQHDSVLFLNNDIIFADAARDLSLMHRVLRETPQTGCVGTMLFYPDGNLQHGGIDFMREGPLSPFCFHPFHNESLVAANRALPELGSDFVAPAVTGACLLIDSKLFTTIGGFDEGYQTECQDVALCLAARRLGYSSRVVFSGEIKHLENATRPKGSEDWQDRRRLMRKWSSFIKAHVL